MWRSGNACEPGNQASIVHLCIYIICLGFVIASETKPFSLPSRLSACTTRKKRVCKLRVTSRAATPHCTSRHGVYQLAPAAARATRAAGPKRAGPSGGPEKPGGRPGPPGAPVSPALSGALGKDLLSP